MYRPARTSEGQGPGSWFLVLPEARDGAGGVALTGITRGPSGEVTEAAGGLDTALPVDAGRLGAGPGPGQGRGVTGRQLVGDLGVHVAEGEVQPGRTGHTGCGKVPGRVPRGVGGHAARHQDGRRRGSGGQHDRAEAAQSCRFGDRTTVARPPWPARGGLRRDAVAPSRVRFRRPRRRLPALRSPMTATGIGLRTPSHTAERPPQAPLATTTFPAILASSRRLGRFRTPPATPLTRP